MDQFFTLPADTPTNAQVARLFRRNFFANFVEGTAWAFGTSFLSVTAILPVYATRLTSSPLVIGLIPALMDAGWFLPQLLMAPSVERKRRQLPAVAWLSVWERLPFLALAIAALWLDRLPRGMAIAVFLVIMLWRAVLSGLVAMPWQELIARIIPVSHRGRFFGVTQLAGQLIGLPGAALAALILARLPYPRNFALCFLIGFLGWVVSYIFLVMTIEPPIAPANAHPREDQVYLVRLARDPQAERQLPGLSCQPLAGLPGWNGQRLHGRLRRSTLRPARRSGRGLHRDPLRQRGDRVSDLGHVGRPHRTQASSWNWPGPYGWVRCSWRFWHQRWASSTLSSP